MKYNRLFGYPGNKIFCVSILNDLIKKLSFKNCELYIEPFVGSGAIFYNLNILKNIKNKYINDIDFNIFLLHKSIQISTYKKYIEIINNIKLNFSDIKTNKETYYNFRDWFNKKYYLNLKNKNFHLETGLILLYLSTTCLNHILRFGPNGMNQSYGNREYIISEKIFNECKNLLNNTKILNVSYEQLINFNNKNCIYFFDPPYELRKMPYSNNFNLDQFLEKLIHINGKNTLIFYTDIENKKSDKLLNYGFNKQIIREMRSISPNRKIGNEITGNEILYWKLIN